MMSVYEEIGFAIGKIQGKQEVLLRMLQRKFGNLPESVTARIEAIKNEAQLDALLIRILDANSLEETGLTTD